MTGPEATVFAARITAAIKGIVNSPGWPDKCYEADRARVARDLAGYRRALDGFADCVPPYTRHARRYTADRDDRMEALTETGALYGVTP